MGRSMGGGRGRAISMARLGVPWCERGVSIALRVSSKRLLRLEFHYIEMKIIEKSSFRVHRRPSVEVLGFGF